MGKNQQLNFTLNKYPEQPGFKKTETSKAAARQARPTAKTLRNQALNLLTERPSTADEIAGLMGATAFAIRPRITELAKQGLIRDSGDRRDNASGRKAIVWEII